MQEKDIDEWIKTSSGYFESHTKQRFSFINFYIIISAALLYSIVLLKKQEIIFYWIVISAHIFELIITFTFYKLDLRSKFLLDNSKRVLKNIERRLFQNKADQDEFYLYNYEEDETKKQKNNRCCPMLCPITYRECFQLLFLSVALYSIGVIGFCLFLYKGH